jgi:HPt (histidine-containing phosphotransfer) domain-containing protein
MEGGSASLVLDLSQLRNVTMNDEALMREVVTALVSDASQQIEQLQQAVERSDAKECRRLAHGLTGACGNVGAVSMAALFAMLEHQAAAGDLGSCRVSIENLSAEVEKLRDQASSI